jgi:hypothetical protein
MDTRAGYRLARAVIDDDATHDRSARGSAARVECELGMYDRRHGSGGYDRYNNAKQEATRRVHE